MHSTIPSSNQIIKNLNTGGVIFPAMNSFTFSSNFTTCIQHHTLHMNKLIKHNDLY